MSKLTKSLMQRFSKLEKEINENELEGSDLLGVVDKQVQILERAIARIENGAPLTPECIAKIEKNLQGK